jgi:hypothetical protein
MNRSTVPSGSGYVWKKMYSAIWSMCGSGALEDRLCDATISALMRLEDHDLDECQLGEDLKYVLGWTKHNLDGERHLKKLPDELQLRKLIETMLHILLETHNPSRLKRHAASARKTPSTRGRARSRFWLEEGIRR